MHFEKYLSVNLAKSSCCCLSNSSSGIPRFSNLVLCLRRLAAISLCSPNTWGSTIGIMNYNNHMYTVHTSSASFLKSPYPSFSKAARTCSALMVFFCC